MAGKFKFWKPNQEQWFYSVEVKLKWASSTEMDILPKLKWDNNILFLIPLKSGRNLK